MADIRGLPLRFVAITAIRGATSTWPISDHILLYAVADDGQIYKSDASVWRDGKHVWEAYEEERNV